MNQAEKAKERSHAYYLSNKEKWKEYARTYRSANKEKIQQQRAARRDSTNEKARLYYHANHEALKERGRAWYRANKKTRREYALKVNFGITTIERDTLFASQGFRCAICGISKDDNPRWHTDHCHSSGKVRGILCHHCNLLLGHAKDRTDVLEKAIAYLKFSEV